MLTERNGKAWAMIKAKTKTRAVNKKRRLYEISGEENELKQTVKRRRLDQSNEEVKSEAEGNHGIDNSNLDSTPMIEFSPKTVARTQASMMTSSFKKLDASSLTPQKLYNI
jgi:hypothetical protein